MRATESRSMFNRYSRIRAGCHSSSKRHEASSMPIKVGFERRLVSKRRMPLA